MFTLPRTMSELRALPLDHLLSLRLHLQREAELLLQANQFRSGKRGKRSGEGLAYDLLGVRLAKVTAEFKRRHLDPEVELAHTVAIAMDAAGVH